METIVIDDLPELNVSLSNIIDLDEDNSNDDVEILEVRKQTNKDKFYDIFKENHVLGQLIERCIELDNSGGMFRVMKRTLVPLYRETDNEYKKSIQFERALTNAVRKIETDPLHKFSHVKGFCEILKKNKEKTQKKKGDLVTFSPKVKEKSFRKKLCSKKNGSKIQRLDNTVINLVEEEFEVPIINLEEQINIVALDINVNVVNNLDNEKENERLNIRVKENSGTTIIEEQLFENDLPQEVVPNQLESNNILFLEPEHSQSTSSKNIEKKIVTQCAHNSFSEKETLNIRVEDNSRNIISEKQILENNLSQVVLPNKPKKAYLEPWYSQAPNSHNVEEEITNQIKIIENQIRTYKSLVDEMNNREVTVDTHDSPYIQSEYFQIKIVKLYKKLCELTGQESVKRREVRLRAVDLRSELPLKKLQALINGNIRSDGLPHFPDFEEVVHCVWAANAEGSLNWDKNKIMYEARALFTYCGRALQRSRQRREWRDMLSIIKSELDDPADTDPELAAKLEANKLIANRKERDLLDKYAAMENNPYKEQIISNDVEMEETDDSEDNKKKQKQIKITQGFSCKDINTNKTKTSALNCEQSTPINGYKQFNGHIHHSPLRKFDNTDKASEQIDCYIHTSYSSVIPNVSKISQPSKGVVPQSKNKVNINQDLNNCQNSLCTDNMPPESRSIRNVFSENKTKSQLNFTLQGNGNQSDHTKVITPLDNGSIQCEKCPDSKLKDCNHFFKSNDPKQLKMNTAFTSSMVDEASKSNLNIGNNLQDVLSQGITNSSNRIEVLNIEIENNLDEDSRPCHEYETVENELSKIQSNTNFARRKENIKNTKDSEYDHKTECRKGTHNVDLQIENFKDIKVKIERTVEDVLRELNEMDDDSLTATIIDIEDPFLVIEISSDSGSDDEDQMDVEDSTKSIDNNNHEDKT